MGIRKVFNDEFLQDHFEKNGYVKIKVLNEQQIELLTRLYLDLTRDTSPDGFFSTAGETTEMKKSMHVFFTAQFSHLWSSVLFDYKCVFSNFITKKSSASEISYHQDWSFIEESTGKCSLNVWCPLVDTFHENGNLVVVPGSQYLKHELRTSNYHYSPYTAYQDFFREQSVEIPTLAGEAIIFDNALMHGSTPNLCDTNRLTASMLGIPLEESIVIHHGSPDKKNISLYKVSDNYLLNYNPFVDVPAKEFLYKQIAFVAPADPMAELNKLKGGAKNMVPANRSRSGFLKKLLVGFK